MGFIVLRVDSNNRTKKVERRQQTKRLEEFDDDGADVAVPCFHGKFVLLEEIRAVKARKIEDLQGLRLIFQVCTANGHLVQICLSTAHLFVM